MCKAVADKTETAVHISQRGFGLLSLGLVSSLVIGVLPRQPPAYKDYIGSCGADNSLLAKSAGISSVNLTC
jgi:hypothetical protein